MIEIIWNKNRAVERYVCTHIEYKNGTVLMYKNDEIIRRIQILDDTFEVKSL